MRTIHFSRLIAVALSLTLLAGCGTQAAKSGPTPSAESAPSSESAPASSTLADEEAYEPVTIQNGDQTITFTKMPEKVLC